MTHEALIATVVAADEAINRRDMAALMDFYDDDATLVMCNLKLSAAGETATPVSMERKPTYVFRKSVDGQWRCVVDNSYGVELVEK